MAETKKKKMYKKYKKKYRQKYGKAYKKIHKPITTVGKLDSGFGDRYFATLRCTFNNIALSSAGSIFNRVEFLMSDPSDLSGKSSTNEFPSGWNTLSEVYNKYICHGYHVSVEFVNTSTSRVIQACIFTSNGDELGAQLDDWEDWQSFPYAKGFALGALNSADSIRNAKLMVKGAKVYGLNTLTSANEDYVGYTGSSLSNDSFAAPAQPTRLIVGISSLDGAALNNTSNPVRCRIKVKLFYEFFNRLRGY